MEFELQKLEEGPLEIISANFDQIRLFTVPQQNGPETRKSFPRQYQWNDFFGRHFRQGFWDVCSPETVPDMSALGTFLADAFTWRHEFRSSVDVSRGGTTLAAWTPLDELRKIDTPEVTRMLAEWDQKVAEFDPQKEFESRIKRHNDWVAAMKAQASRYQPIASRPRFTARSGDGHEPPGKFVRQYSLDDRRPAGQRAIWHQAITRP